MIMKYNSYDRWFIWFIGMTVCLAVFSAGCFVGLRKKEQQVEKWRQEALSWQYAAEYYGGICKWLLEDKPIYGTIEVGDGATLSDCLIVSGSKEASIEVSGTNCLISNIILKVMDMDWVNSTTAIDPNDPNKYAIIIED